MITLRPYQQQVVSDIHKGWEQHRNVLAVLPTGGGKTVVFGSILASHPGLRVAIAHRQELVCQISMALAMFGVEHNVIAPKSVVAWIRKLQVAKYGHPYISPHGKCFVAGVDTVLSRKDELKNLFAKMSLWVQDECHHLMADNKWGKAATLMPNAKGLGVTATPVRSDGKGLGRHADGLMDYMVVGPSMRELIDMGYLSDYIIYGPPCSINLADVKISPTTGDYSKKQLVTTVRKSKIIGDIVSHYQRYAAGKLGVTFVTDVKTAGEVAEQYQQAGVPAKAVSAKTPERERHQTIESFRRRELLQLVNVDLFGEGFDLPAIETVSMARPTASFAVFSQQFGRALRILEGKERAIIIDHVGNCMQHGLPDSPRRWTLDARDRKSRNKAEQDVIPVKSCKTCTGVYEAFFKTCPYCGAVPKPASRSAPEFVEGDLTELTPETLAALRGEVKRVDGPADQVREKMLHAGAPRAAAYGAEKNHRVRQEAQFELRESIALWAGYQKHIGRSDAESYRLFWYKFGMDVLTAQALGKRQALELKEKIEDEIRSINS